MNDKNQLVLLSTLLLLAVSILSACTSPNKQAPADPHAFVNGGHSSQSETVEPTENRQFMNSKSQGETLWIWIAPDYRKDLPDSNTEYLVEQI